jgi:hypothetical protein
MHAWDFHQHEIAMSLWDMCDSPESRLYGYAKAFTTRTATCSRHLLHGREIVQPLKALEKDGQGQATGRPSRMLDDKRHIRICWRIQGNQLANNRIAFELRVSRPLDRGLPFLDR